VPFVHSLVLTEEQESIQRAARAFVQAKFPITHLRALRDRRDPVGFSRDAWREMAALGLVGVTIPEAYGGAGLGFAELGLVLEECGRTLAPTPLIASVVMGASALMLAGTSAQKEAHLPAVSAGERILTLAHEERARHARFAVATRAEKVAGGWRITGEKTMVEDGHVADVLVVVARTSGTGGERAGLGLFLVPRVLPGVAVERLSLIDSRNAARVRFDGVTVSDGDVLGVAGEGGDLLDALLDRAAVALSAEMLGGASEAFERTVLYLKTRQQFGVPIGSFQALKHRAAHMFCEIELTKSIVLEALRATGDGRPDVPMLASAAKARATDTFLLVANEAIQMHGGIGVTDELEIGFFLKRARVAEMICGDAAYHRDRYARCLGY
jgi:alkylation response protein AidB-like acyl-CoA dehydrogenase